MKHELLVPYPVLVAPNAIVASFTMTVAIMSTSTIAITGINFNEEQFSSDKKITDENLLKLLE